MRARLKNGQYYELPDGRWARAIALQPNVWHLHVLDRRPGLPGGDDGYRVRAILNVQPNGLLDAPGAVTSSYWTLEDLREATPDEAEAQQYQQLGIV